MARIFVGDSCSAPAGHRARRRTTSAAGSQAEPCPAEVLDAGGTASTASSTWSAARTAPATARASTSTIPQANSWSTAPNLPGPAVENPAVAAANGKLYAFGGSTAAFSGAVTNAAVLRSGTELDRAAPRCRPLAVARPRRRSAARSMWTGGMDADGASLDSVEVFDITTDGVERRGTPMGTRRDNPGSAVLATASSTSSVAALATPTAPRSAADARHGRGLRPGDRQLDAAHRCRPAAGRWPSERSTAAHS